MFVPVTTFEVLYKGKDITRNILPYVKAFTYTDKSRGESDEIDLTLEDSSRLWANEWYPTKGDQISAKIKDSGRILHCGTFTIDELTGSGSVDGGDVFQLKGVATGVTNPLRSKNTYAHEFKTLREIVNTIAAKHKFKVVGTIDDIRIERETQFRETDLQFLKRLAHDYGYYFSIRDSTLVFESVFKIEGKNSVFTVTKKDIKSWSITDKTSNTFKQVRVKHHNRKKKSTIKFTDYEKMNVLTASDILEVRKRVENSKQAEAMGRALLHKANSLGQEGNIEIVGNVLAVAGVIGEIDGLGMFSGKYFIDTSTHSVSPEGGYSTSLGIKRVGLLTKDKQK